MSPDTAAEKLAQFLPMIVNKLTPHGRWRKLRSIDASLNYREAGLGRPFVLHHPFAWLNYASADLTTTRISVHGTQYMVVIDLWKAAA
jgi:hypothetical protein